MRSGEHSAANIQTSRLGLEACSGSHFLERALRKQRCDVRLIPAQFVKPFLKSNKNDFANAEAIAEAVERISSIENLCRESNEPLTKIDYTGLNLEQSLKKISFHILKLITAKGSVELHRLAIGEAVNCPEVGHAWYKHGPARAASFIRSLLESHRDEFPKTAVTIERTAVMLHDSLTGDILYRLLAGVGKHQNDAELERFACGAVDVILGSVNREVP